MYISFKGTEQKILGSNPHQGISRDEFVHYSAVSDFGCFAIVLRAEK
jgi:hypothetical protein